MTFIELELHLHDDAEPDVVASYALVWFLGLAAEPPEFQSGGTTKPQVQRCGQWPPPTPQSAPIELLYAEGFYSAYPHKPTPVMLPRQNTPESTAHAERWHELLEHYRVPGPIPMGHLP